MGTRPSCSIASFFLSLDRFFFNLPYFSSIIHTTKGETMLKMRCTGCGWSGDGVETKEGTIVVDGHNVRAWLCPKCGARTSETLVDLDDAEHLYLKHGDRFLNWYMFKSFNKKETLPLGKDSLSMEFDISEFTVKFVMPSTIKVSDGMISYSTGERLLGMFRFPRNLEGDFLSPFSKKDGRDWSKITPEELARMPHPLVFEAFRIPTHTFQYSDLTDSALVKITELCGAEHAEIFKLRHGEMLQAALGKILERIESGHNFLLILGEVLCRKRVDLDEVAAETDKIIHIG